MVSYEQDGTAVAASHKGGTYKVVVTAGENGDYEGIASGQPTYTIAKKTITASLNGTLTKTYDGTTKVLEAQKLTVLLKGVEDGDKVTATADAYAYNSAEVKGFRHHYRKRHCTGRCGCRELSAGRDKGFCECKDLAEESGKSRCDTWCSAGGKRKEPDSGSRKSYAGWNRAYRKGL